MKTLKTTLFSLILAVNVTGAHAQTSPAASSTITTVIPSTGSEGSTNQLLLNNAQKSREAIEKKNANEPVQQIRNFGGQKTTSQMNLTDQEKQLSENYIHQGKANEIIKANCTGEMASVCSGNEGKHKFMGMDPNMVKAISQGYAMFSALAGDSFGGISKGEGKIKEETQKAQAAAKESGGQAEKVDKKANDYCKYIPTVTEGVATAVQMAKSAELKAEEVGNGETAQKDALLKAAKSHDSRAKMAQIQAVGWWGGAACYAVNASMGNFATDTNLVLKMGAATLLGAFYQNEVAANKEYAEKTRNIANQLPGKGDCNPITDNLCYCSQPSTENDPTYCMKGLHNKALAANSYRVACTTNELKIDPTCTCEKSGTCFDNLLEMQGEGALQLGGLAYSNSPFSPVRSLARGELVGGTVNGLAYARTAAIAKKGLQEAMSKLQLPNQPLTKDQKGLVDAMMSQGVPANVATLMAQNPPSAAATNAAMGKFSGASGMRLASVAPAKSNIVDFSGGSGLINRGSTKGSDDGASELLAKLKPGAKAAPNSKIIEFAQRAEEKARQSGQIQKDTTPLFEIISMRYQTSGRRLLQIDPSN